MSTTPGGHLPFLGTEWCLVALAAGMIGLIVGAGELIARYRDAPGHALQTPAALLYMFINGLVAAGAFALIDWANMLQLHGTANGLLWEVLASGFGAMAFFRSSLFTMRIGDKDVSVGPAIFLQVLLSATDRGCDRARAEPRARAIRQIMDGVDFHRAAAALPDYCFKLMQNVSREEQQQFATVIAELRNAEMDDAAKTYTLGLALMNVVGQGVLSTAVDSLGAQIRGGVPTLSIESISQLATLDFRRDAVTLATACVTLSGQDGDLPRSEVLRRVTEVGEMAMQEQDKTLLLATYLAGRFGPLVFAGALGFAGKVPAGPAAVVGQTDANVVDFRAAAGGEAEPAKETQDAG